MGAPGSATIAEILQVESLDSTARPSFQALLERLWESGYSGSLTIHFHTGYPKVVEFHQVVRVELAPT